MPDLPTRFADLIVCFAPLFRQRTWRHTRERLRGGDPCARGAHGGERPASARLLKRAALHQLSSSIEPRVRVPPGRRTRDVGTAGARFRA